MNLNRVEPFPISPDYQAHDIHPGNLAVSQDTTDVDCNLEAATNTTKPCWFFRPYNVVWRVDPTFAGFAAVLNKKCAERSIEVIGKTRWRQTTHPMKTVTEANHPVSGVTFAINTHLHSGYRCCDHQVRSIFLQQQTLGSDKPIGYCARFLNDYDCTYDSVYKASFEVASRYCFSHHNLKPPGSISEPVTTQCTEFWTLCSRRASLLVDSCVHLSLNSMLGPEQALNIKLQTHFCIFWLPKNIQPTWAMRYWYSR